MKATVALKKSDNVLSLLIEPVSMGFGIHKVKVVRSEPNSKVRIAVFMLNSEGHCFEFLKQIAPELGHSNPEFTSTVMQAIQDNKIKELYNGD